MPEKAEGKPKEFDIADLQGGSLLLNLDGITNFLLHIVSADAGFRSKTAYVEDLIGRSLLAHLEEHDLIQKTEDLATYFRDKRLSDQPEA